MLVTIQPTNFSVTLYDDRNEDSIPEQSELLQTQTVSSVLRQKDSMRVEFVWNNPPAGKHLLIVVIDYPEDMRSFQ